MKTLIIKRKQKDEKWATKDIFLIEDYIKHPDKALKDAIKAFIKTKKGKEIINEGELSWEA